MPDDVEQHAGDVGRIGHHVGAGRVDAVGAADLQVDGLPSPPAAAGDGRPVPSRVSRTRDGVVGMQPGPVASAAVGATKLLVENQPNTSTTTWAVPLWPNSPIVSWPSAPGRTMATLGTVWLGAKLMIEVRTAGWAPLP